MDLGTLIGFVLGIALVLGSILLTGELGAFISVSSVLIVVGGTVASTLIAFSLSAVIGGILSLIGLFKGHKVDFARTVKILIEGAEAARKGGGIALEKIKIDDSFITLAFQLVADGYKASDVNDLLRIEQEAALVKQQSNQKVLEKMGDLGPAWGMIGTLIGLVIMLMNLSDPSSIGPAMAVALLTTLYGALLANFVCIPAAVKIEERSEAEQMNMRLITEGAAAIARNENPRQVQLRLMSFIPPQIRSQIQGAAKGKKK